MRKRKRELLKESGEKNIRSNTVKELMDLVREKEETEEETEETQETEETEEDVAMERKEESGGPLQTEAERVDVQNELALAEKLLAELTGKAVVDLSDEEELYYHCCFLERVLMFLSVCHLLLIRILRLFAVCI